MVFNPDAKTEHQKQRIQILDALLLARTCIPAIAAEINESHNLDEARSRIGRLLDVNEAAVAAILQMPLKHCHRHIAEGWERERNQLARKLVDGEKKK